MSKRTPAFIVASASPGAGTATPAPDVVAQARHAVVHVYRSPRAVKPFRQFRSPTADGVPLVFLVKERANGWEKVYLPVRPNGATGWVRDRDVDLSLDSYRVVVELRAHRLSLYRAGRLVLRTQAGVGRSVLPTPQGTYYITELLKQGDARGPYGPYAFGLSAHSNVLYSFGGGPGQIGIHGTNEPWALGSNVSHGCIRIDNATITRLANLLPLGTRVVIRN